MHIDDVDARDLVGDLLSRVPAADPADLALSTRTDVVAAWGHADAAAHP